MYNESTVQKKLKRTKGIYSGLSPLGFSTSKARFVSRILIVVLLLSAFALPPGTEGMIDSSYADTNKTTKNSTKFISSESSTPPAVTTPVSITTVQAKAIKNQPYSGKAIKPAVKLTAAGKSLTKNKDYKLSYKNNKNPGTATVKVTGMGNYTGTMDLFFTIYIKAPTKVKVKNDKKKITVSWKKVAGTSGYKVIFATDRNFTKKEKTRYTKSPNKLKCQIETPVVKKTYYIKVRAYKTINGKKYYGKASAIKKIKVKSQKWIEVDLSKQKIYLKKGKKKIKTYIVSTGKKKTPTIKGTFYVYRKVPMQDMVGRWDPEKNAPEYIQPDVKWVTYFKGGYAFHATYWHNNLGTPMSHGCVNMKTKEAKYLYKWAPMGTKVVVHK